MSRIPDRVYGRLKQLKAERGELKMNHFADLGLEAGTIHRFLKDLEAEHLVEESFRPRYRAQEGRRMIADFSFYITDEGREEFEAS
jgi:predicted ArsR family transcriptional regulator